MFLLGGIKELLGSDHPVLESCAKYFFEIDGGKKIRPTMVLAVSYALNSQSQSLNQGPEGRRYGASPSQKRLAEITEMIHTASLFHDDVIDKVSTLYTSLLNIGKKEQRCHVKHYLILNMSLDQTHPSMIMFIFPSQSTLLSQAATRRGVPSVNQAFGNKLAILGGDFLLSRASISLARLRNLEVIYCI